MRKSCRGDNMDITKTRKQGNAVMVTVPKSFNVGEGVTLHPRLTDKGIFYEFVNEDDFFDFDEDILKDLVSQGVEGQELIDRFKEMKKNIPAAIDKLIGEAEEETAKTHSMSREEFEKEIGL